MISLKKLLKELSQIDPNQAAVSLDNVVVEDLSFPFHVTKGPTPDGVYSHEIITISAFDTPDKENVKLQSYHLIFGESSMAIFDAFGVDETAGLTRVECQQHLDRLAQEGKTETWDGAYIAGLTNWSGDQLYCFYNVGRISMPGYCYRVLPHESLHLARNLITLDGNEFVRANVGKGEWWADERAKFADLTDDNEELFAEVLERCAAIAYNRWEREKIKFTLPPK